MNLFIDFSLLTATLFNGGLDGLFYHGLEEKLKEKNETYIIDELVRLIDSSGIKFPFDSPVRKVLWSMDNELLQFPDDDHRGLENNSLYCELRETLLSKILEYEITVGCNKHVCDFLKKHSMDHQLWLLAFPYSQRGIEYLVRLVPELKNLSYKIMSIQDENPLTKEQVAATYKKLICSLPNPTVYLGSQFHLPLDTMELILSCFSKTFFIDGNDFLVKTPEGQQFYYNDMLEKFLTEIRL